MNISLEPTTVFATFSDVIQSAFDALSSGSLYAMFALSIALLFGVVRLVNFAQGSVIMGAAYAVVIAAGSPVAVKFLLCVTIAVILSFVVERLAFRPFRHTSPTTLLVTSFLVGALLQGIAEIIDNNEPRSTDVWRWLDGSIKVGDVVVAKVSVMTFAVTAVTVVLLAGFLKRSRTGVEMRAAAENFRMSQALGIRSDRVIGVAFVISGLLAGVSSFFYVAQSGTVTPTIGITPLLFGLVGTVVGGLGSLSGAVLGGFILGAGTEILQSALPESLVPYRDAFVFAAVFFLLVTRPQGLFGSTAGERV